MGAELPIGTSGAAVPSHVTSAALPRSRLFFGLFLLATLNAFIGIAVRAVEEHGWGTAVAGLFEISAILWLALTAGLKLLVDDSNAAAWKSGDRTLAGLVLFAALIPSASVSTVSLSLLACWGIATAAPRSPLRRASIIFLAMTGALIWGRLMLALFSRPLLDIDAFFVSQLLGAGHDGNMIWSQDNGVRLIVAPGCSSMQGLSLALVFWATVNQFFRVRFDRRAVLHCLAALGATVAVNVLRIGAMLRWPQHLEAIHYGWGWHVANWTSLILVVAICLHGARHEILGRR